MGDNMNSIFSEAGSVLSHSSGFSSSNSGANGNHNHLPVEMPTRSSSDGGEGGERQGGGAPHPYGDYGGYGGMRAPSALTIPKLSDTLAVISRIPPRASGLPGKEAQPSNVQLPGVPMDRSRKEEGARAVETKGQAFPSAITEEDRKRQEGERRVEASPSSRPAFQDMMIQINSLIDSRIEPLVERIQHLEALLTSHAQGGPHFPPQTGPQAHHPSFPAASTHPSFLHPSAHPQTYPGFTQHSLVPALPPHPAQLAQAMPTQVVPYPRLPSNYGRMKRGRRSKGGAFPLAAGLKPGEKVIKMRDSFVAIPEEWDERLYGRKPAKLCLQPECTQYRQFGKFCNNHGGGTKCREPSCSCWAIPYQYGDLCKKHGEEMEVREGTQAMQAYAKKVRDALSEKLEKLEMDMHPHAEKEERGHSRKRRKVEGEGKEEPCLVLQLEDEPAESSKAEQKDLSQAEEAKGCGSQDKKNDTVKCFIADCKHRVSPLDGVCADHRAFICPVEGCFNFAESVGNFCAAHLNQFLSQKQQGEGDQRGMDRDRPQGEMRLNEQGRMQGETQSMDSSQSASFPSQQQQGGREQNYGAAPPSSLPFPYQDVQSYPDPQGQREGSGGAQGARPMQVLNYGNYGFYQFHPSFSGNGAQQQGGVPGELELERSNGEGAGPLRTSDQEQLNYQGLHVEEGPRERERQEEEGDRTPKLP